MNFANNAMGNPNIGFGQFGSPTYVQGGPEFLHLNSIVAKFAFLVFVLIIFIVLLRIGSYALGWLFAAKENPVLLDGMINARQMVRIPQDPAVKGAIPIMRSKNERDGLEFTWSVWIYCDDFTYKEHEFKHIFHKGNDNINLNTQPFGKNFPNNAPGLYITPDTNDLVVLMNTFDAITEEVRVKDLPLNKWVNVIIRVSKQYQLDVYINGSLSKRHMLAAVPKQNYGDVYVSMNGGFSGYTSNLRYFEYALGTSKIQSILSDGPSMKLLGGNQMEGSQIPKYLSARWYFRGADDV